MRVFISWSKQVSREVAEALYDWLPFVIQDVDPWMSKADLEAGVRWGQELSSQLQSNDFGIICLTAQNRLEPWIHFEAGALSKQVATARVIPLLFRMDLTTVPSPLQQFQAVTADQTGTWSIVRSLYSGLPKSTLSFSSLERTFAKWWPELEAKWTSITVPEGAPEVPPFNQEAEMQEVLLTIRELSRGNTRLASAIGVSLEPQTRDLMFNITNSAGVQVQFGGVAAVLAKLANDYMRSHSIPWSQALAKKMEISRALWQAPNVCGLFLTQDKLHDAVVNVLKRFEAASSGSDKGAVVGISAPELA
ncbi:MAG: toll/interleukin-1 receptor domain-containing protein [Pirellulaceae bacterium]|nr:toll/interleukin-1 receptor domain-containing protein [Pirellulaceae bacterium]